MWSKAILCRFRQPGKIPQTQALQGFPAFHVILSRIPPRHSQTRRDTNFAIPGYSISAMIPRRGVKIKFFCLWSFMWSKPLLCRFQQPGEIPKTQALQGFAAFRLTLSRIQPRHSQTRRDTNFAIPGDVSLSYHVLQEKATGRAQKICARPDLFAVPQFGFEIPKVPKLCIFKRLRGNRNTKGNWEFAVWTGGLTPGRAGER